MLDTNNKVIVGYFKRGLVGGIIKVNNVQIKVPETVIRRNNYRHGDLLRAYYHNMDNIKYEKLEDSTTAHECQRRSVNYAVVDDDSLDSELIAKEQIVQGKKQPILLNNTTPFSFRISDFDQKKFNILPGDIIDIAYFASYPQTYKIAFKHK